MLTERELDAESTVVVVALKVPVYVTLDVLSRTIESVNVMDEGPHEIVGYTRRDLVTSVPEDEEREAELTLDDAEWPEWRMGW